MYKKEKKSVDNIELGSWYDENGPDDSSNVKRKK
jgi:hypothetical protein